MTEYTKKTVAELQEILKSRGLPSSGKKADLVARLTEADKETEEQAAEKAEPAPATAPAPTQSEQPKAATEQPASTEKATGQDGAPQAAESEANQTDEAPAVESKMYTLNLASSDVNDEMAKRKARAARFGTGGASAAAEEEANGEAGQNSDPSADSLKNLERAKRFGTGQTAIGKLDEALSSEREHGHGRKRKGGPAEESNVMDDPGLRRGFRPGGRGGFRGRRRGGGGGVGGGDRPSGVTKPAAAYSSDKDREAAEARRKRFAAA